jgi:FkbM family methyltransferase
MTYCEEEELVTNTIGRHFWIYKNDSFYHQRIANAGPYQKHNLMRLRDLAPNARTILDVGMNIGMNTIEYATWAKKVISFEPTPQTFDMARRNIELAQAQTDADMKKRWYYDCSCKLVAEIEIHNIGLGETAGKFDLIVQRNNAGQNHLESTKVKKREPKVEPIKVSVEVKTIDSLNFTDVDIIKIDTEGFEFPVVKGAEKTILSQLPVVQVEMIESQLKRFDYTAQDVYDWFLARDFVITLSDGSIAPNKWQKVPKKVERFFIHKSKMNTLV